MNKKFPITDSLANGEFFDVRIPSKHLNYESRLDVIFSFVKDKLEEQKYLSKTLLNIVAGLFIVLMILIFNNMFVVFLFPLSWFALKNYAKYAEKRFRDNRYYAKRVVVVES